MGCRTLERSPICPAAPNDTSAAWSGWTAMGVSNLWRLPPRDYYGNAVISPDGRFAAVDVSAGTIDLWIYDFSRATLTPLTTGTGSSQAPRWTPDGKHIIYRGTRTGFRNLWWKSVDDTAIEERLTDGEACRHPDRGRLTANGWSMSQTIQRRVLTCGRYLPAATRSRV